VVGKAIEATAPLLEERRHHLHVRVPADGLAVEADEVRLTQVVSNLLTNAARYTPSGGTVEVAAAREGDEVVLQVTDNGIGIDPGLLPYLFDMFVQGPRGVDRAEGGLGLGLSLVRTLTELHGGAVAARSDGEGRGSTFTVRLPKAAEPLRKANGRTRAERKAAGAPSRKVLVVDDNRDAAEMVSILLTSAGHQVEIATDASQALATVSAFHPQIAILDIGLPVMDGYALARELRTRMGQAVPILIALTGYGQEQDQLRSTEAGFARHLVKPFDAKRLLYLVDTLGRN